MGHAIDTSTGRAAMAFVGETPWHDLGQRLTEASTIEEWTVQAGLKWDALVAPAQFIRADGTMGNTDSRVIYRSDTGAALSVMGSAYVPHQPAQIMQFFAGIAERHNVRMHTAGALHGGRVLWALARNSKVAEVVKGDKIARFLLLSTSLDGTQRTEARWTSVRVVCANTLGMARATAADHSQSHRSAFDLAAAQDAMGVSADGWDEHVATMAGLADRRCTLGEARDILRTIFGNPVKRGRGPSVATQAMQAIQSAKLAAKPATAPAAPADADSFAALLQRPAAPFVSDADAVDQSDGRGELARLLASGAEREQKSVARVLALFNGEGRGATHPGVAGTRWGLLNAVTEHLDHEAGRDQNARLASAWFGKGDAAKQSALAALVAA